MKSSTVLRTSVVLHIGAFVLGTGLELALNSSLPPQLRDWRPDTETRSFVSALAYSGTGLIVCVFWIVALVGLLRLKRWAAWLYLFSVLN